MYFTSLTLRGLILWGMIPLAVLGGLPLAVCQCVSGQQKFFCGQLNQVVQSPAEGCCSGKGESAASESRQPGAPGVSSRCCRLVVVRPSAGIVDRATAPQEQAQLAAFSTVDVLRPQVVELERAVRDLIAKAPPLDLVIRHRSLLI